MDILTACGMAGTAVIVIAYFGNLSGRLPSADWRFPMANLAGSLLILGSLMQAWNLPSVVIEVFWAAISLYGLWRSIRTVPASGRNR
ncbi:MAG TPA: hypothetical protein VE690_18080 [Rhodopila sp.]|jgi:hypothetical protein|nr:hypothetical protein [Rhodopila sp.]